MMIFENVGGDEVMLKIDWGKRADKTPEEKEMDKWREKYEEKFGESYGINLWGHVPTREEAIEEMKRAIETGEKIEFPVWVENDRIIQ